MMEFFAFVVKCLNILLIFVLLASCDIMPQKYIPPWTDEQQIRIKAIKQDILEHLGLQKPPRVKQHTIRAEEQRMYKLYLEQTRKSTGNYSFTEHHSMKIKIPVNVHDAGGMLSMNISERNTSLKRKQMLKFNLSAGWSQNMKVIQGELKFSIKLKEEINRRQNMSAEVHLVEIYHVMKAKAPGNGFRRQMLASKLITTQSRKKERFRFRKLADHWNKNPEENVEIEVAYFLIQSSENNGYNATYNIQVELEIEAHKILKPKRIMREVEGEDCQENQTQCCRKPLLVSFKDMGWSDWIVAPQSYNAFYCDGTCPAKYKAANAYSVIKSKMHSLSKGQIPGPQCAPALHEPLTIMHFDSEGKLTISALDNMIVSKCSCS
ncbi:protein DVR-1-like [Protopterus annectens]|uniref:protein DVR-1-like n=1 Tax=Protopterus annectens TaxID=7888 RepID=UPI001CFAD944|nr:protein DVR-1-like [Protopterus annectens]